MARAELPKVSVPNVQLDRAEKLEQLCIEIWRAWLLRDLRQGGGPGPEARAMRLGPEAYALRESVFAHAERIVLAGILTPAQSSECLRAFWKLVGLRALLDPTMVGILGLTPQQREGIVSLFQLKVRTAQEDRSASEAMWGLRDRPGVAAQLKEMATNASARQEEIDGEIWGVLNARQARQLKSIIGAAQPPSQRATGKPRKVRST